MKIAIDLRSLGYKPWSGVGYYTALLIKELQARYQEQWIFFDNRFHPNQQLKTLVQSNNQLFQYQYPNKLFSPSERFLNWPKFESLVHEPELIWFPNLTFVNKKKGGKTKRIVTIHDCSFMIHPEWYPWKERLWHFMLAKNLLNYFDYFIAVSQSTKDELIKTMKIPAEKIKVIYSGLDKLFFEKISESELNNVKGKYNLPDKYFLFLGDVMKRKNVQLIIETIAELKRKNILKGYKLIIAGKIKDQNLVNYVKKNQLELVVKFLGYVDSLDRPALYAMAQAFIFPSFYEGFGFPVLEAAACGCLVICSKETSLPELMGNNALYTESNQKESLVQKLTQVIDNPLQFRDLVDKAKVRAAEFNWSKTAEELYNYFKEIYENRI